MKKSFEDRNLKPTTPSVIITMTEFVNLQIHRVILAKKKTRVFHGYRINPQISQ